jgi:hypothetical protein
VESSIFLI